MNRPTVSEIRRAGTDQLNKWIVRYVEDYWCSTELVNPVPYAEDWAYAGPLFDELQRTADPPNEWAVRADTGVGEPDFKCGPVNKWGLGPIVESVGTGDTAIKAICRAWLICKVRSEDE